MLGRESECDKQKNIKGARGVKQKNQLARTIYHCEHKHKPSDCFGKNAAKKKLWIQAVKVAEKSDIKVREFVISPLEHRIFLILEAPSFESVEHVFGSLKTLGEMSITPVLDGSFFEL